MLEMFKNYSSNPNINLFNVICVIVMLYLLYRDLTRKEGFGQTEDINAAINTRYGADVEAIRNLSELATKLTTGGLTVPGNVQINGQLKTTNDYLILGDDSTNKWTLHTPNDARKSMWIARHGATTWDWDKSININDQGDLTVPGNLKINGQLKSQLKSTDTYLILGDDSTNKWTLHTPNDARKSIWIARHGATTWDWDKSININDQGDLTIPGNIITNGRLKIYPIIGAYMIDAFFGSSTGDQYSISFSIPNYVDHNMSDKDDYYIVLPGYKLIVYADLYSGNNSIMDNTTGTEAKGFMCNIWNQYNGTNGGSSCKLFYNNEELIFHFLTKIPVVKTSLVASNVRTEAQLSQAVKG